MDSKNRRPVRKLSVDVARKIAAGEVIDRPAAIVRELMDNAVDSGADSITVEVSGGGIEKVRVSDNGWGMSVDDLKNCAQPHATSKIVDADDLMNLSTLGFRGEALASIAAVSKLSISSGTSKMTALVGEEHKIQTVAPVQNGVGTIVQSESLFEDFPARRRFLKRPASETLMCREIFVEKSLPRTDISFRLVVDGTIRYDLPKGQTLAERFVKACELKDSAKLFSEIKNEGYEADGKTKWSFNLVIGNPEVYRNDRKQIFIYVNGRKVQEFSLLQAVEYGCQGFFPNGVHPVAVLFVQVDPSMVDFNIHPAKKEVRFKDISSLHHGVSSTTKNFFRSYGIKSNLSSEENTTSETEPEVNLKVAEPLFEKFSSEAIPSTSGKFHNLDFSSFQTQKKTSDEYSDSISSRIRKYESNPYKTDFSQEKKAVYEIKHTSLIDEALSSGKMKVENGEVREESGKWKVERYERKVESGVSTGSTTEWKSVNSKAIKDFKFFGTTLGTFLMAEVDGVLYLIDQHAAHERILFDKLMESKGQKQNLLLPLEIETDSQEEEAYIESLLQELDDVGFAGKKIGDGKFQFSTIPARWNGSEENLKSLLLDSHLSPKDLVYKIAAMTACRAAVMDGTLLDSKRAEDLAREALTLPDPHCPHGRPVWIIFTKEQLFGRVRRT